MDGEAYNQGSCGPTDKKICFLLVLDSVQAGKAEIELLKELSQKYRGDPINFFYTDIQTLERAEGVVQPAGGRPFVFVIKGKRRRYFSIPGPLSREVLEPRLDALVSGGQRFTRIDSLNDRILFFRT